jgi:autotransporter-associated beta strand repeat
LALLVKVMALGAFADGAGGGSLSLIKTGTGTQILGGASTNTGSTTISQGILQLDFNLASAPANQILGSGTTLVLGGGILALTGSGTVANSQTLAGTEVNSGLSTISLTRHTGTPQDLVLQLGDFSVQP